MKNFQCFKSLLVYICVGSSGYACFGGGGTRRLNREQEARKSSFYSNVIAHLLRNLKFVLKRSRIMCAMTGLNIQQFFVLFGDGVIRWHVFVRILRYYGTRSVRSIIKISHLLGEGVSNGHPIHLFTHSLKKRAAFTLAEVLITLGIIGVVAAMTLPALIANHQKKVASTKLKKFYSTMQNVLNFATLDYGEMRYWEFPTKQNDGAQMSKFATTYIFPYLQGVKQCNTTENSECFFYANKIFDQGLPVLYIFNDGSCFGMNIGGAGIGMGNIHIIYDYNCMQNPNKYGKDVFEFLINWLGDKYIFKGGGFSTRNMTTREELLNFCKNAQNTARGECASLIQFDNWEIKDDYPWY